MSEKKQKTIILGSFGFIGKFLIQQMGNSIGLSLRDPLWKSSLQGVDIIINLVGKAHDHKGTATESDYQHANVELAKQIFDEFVKSEAKLLIHISSLAALEEFESRQPLIEEDACHPISWYGKTKREAEEWLLCQELPEDKKLIILRPPMVHGPGDKGNLGLLYKLISKGIPYPLGAFNNKRSFISIGNFCFYIEQIIEKHNLLKSGIYHVADDQPISTKEIIQIIKEVTGKRGVDLALPKALIYAIARIGDRLPIPLNTSRLKKNDE